MGKKVGQIVKPPKVKQSNSNSRVRRAERLQSMDTPVDRILYLQRTAGNQAVSRLMRSGALQAKLRIGQPGDVYEQEADRVADAVMRMPEPGVQRQVEPEDEKERQAKPINGVLRRQSIEEEEEIVQPKTEVSPIQRQSIEEELEETLPQPQPQLIQGQEGEEEPLSQTKLVQRQDTEEEKTTPQARLVQRQEAEEEESVALRKCEKYREKESSAVSTKKRDLNKAISKAGAGEPLKPYIQSVMEFSTGHDFRGVRVHTDGASHKANRAIKARAFTHGADVWLGQGQSQNDTHLMAHELTHVVQQRTAHGRTGSTSGKTQAHLIRTQRGVGSWLKGKLKRAWGGIKGIPKSTWNAVKSLGVLAVSVVRRLGRGAANPIQKFGRKVVGFLSRWGRPAIAWLNKWGTRIIGWVKKWGGVRIVRWLTTLGPRVIPWLIKLGIKIWKCVQGFILGLLPGTSPAACCSVEKFGSITADSYRARKMLLVAQLKLSTYAMSLGRWPSSVRRAMRDHFGTTFPPFAAVLARSARSMAIQSQLATAGTIYVCFPNGIYPCTGRLAWVPWCTPGNPIVLCDPPYFNLSGRERSTTLIHEWAHKFWCKLDIGYEDEPEYPSNLFTASLNAGNFANLVRDVQ